MCLGFRDKSNAKRAFARPKRRWEDIKMERKGTGCEAWSRLFGSGQGK